jgi:uroporphyrin-III C-methyltransferase
MAGMNFEPGTVWLVGAGPGDPGLLTLHAAHALVEADVVLHDALVSPEILALAPQARLEPVGKRAGGRRTPQLRINERMIRLAREGNRVVRLKGGDPLVFGRGGEEALALAAAGIPFRIVPGVTSGLAALTVASIPATLRGVNQALILVTSHCGDEEDTIDWAALVQTGQPIVLYMGLRNLDGIAASLLDAGLDPHEPVAVIASATLSEQRILISELHRVAAETRELEFEAPAIIAIGAIVRVRQKLLDLAARVPEMVA